MFDPIANIPAVVTFLALDVAGLVALYGLFDRQLKTKQKEKYDLEESIRSDYQERVGMLEKKIHENKAEVQQLRDEVKSVTAENGVMKEILQGRDKESIEHRKRAEEAMTRGIETYDIVKTNSGRIAEMADAINRLVGSIDRHIANEEKLLSKFS